MKRRIGILTSGGDCPGLNATIRGVAKACYQMLGTENVEIVGISDGYYGLIHNICKEMKPDDFSGILTRGGTILGTKRQPFKMMKVIGDDNIDKVKNMKKTYQSQKLDCLLTLGGNGTHKTSQLLSEEGLNVIGLPKTIDNDLCMIDHTPGFGSAAKYIASTMLEIAHDTFIYAVKSVTIVEIMGRDAGWLTAASALARNDYNTAPHFIYLPEVAFDKEQFLTDIRNKLKTLNNVIVAVSEGIRDKNGDYITASKAVADQFGHQQLSGAGKALEFLVKENIGVKVRSIEINVLQRCASHLASATDQSEAFALGEHAVLLAEEGVTASMVTLTRTSNTPYAVAYDHAPIRGIANEAKSIPREWINAHGNDIRQELYNYLYPLIQGEVSLTYQNGVPVYMPVPHLKPDHVS